MGLSVKWSSKNFEDSRGEWFAWDEGWASCISDDQTQDIGIDDDIVYEELDGRWRIPAAEELIELVEKCEWIQVVERNKKGKVNFMLFKKK